MTGTVNVLTLLGPWPLWLPFFGLALCIFRLETRQVRHLMAEYGHQGAVSPDLPDVKRHVWGHAAALSVILMLSSVGKPFELMTSGLFVLFIFRMSLIDTLTGWLPREFTWPFLVAGLGVAAASHTLSVHAAQSLILLVAGWLVRAISGHFSQRETLGIGDVWLAAGLGAWFGLPVSLFSLIGGLAGFTLWHASSRNAHVGGPLGPWLGYSALLTLALNISEPLLMW